MGNSANSQRFTIPGRFSSLNDFVSANRTNARYGNRIKKRETERAARACASLVPVTGPVAVAITWYEPNRRRDLDNVYFAKKYILDGLVAAGIIPNDTQRWVRQLRDDIKIDREHPRVEVTICKLTE